jgi:phosphoribosylformimino-5-aminoimidazole carboxamide ribotide isomerase
MIIIPAIDLMNNQCVRLSQGDFESRTIYSSDPAAMAVTFSKTGFTHLHLVDLDGAKARTPKHLHILKQVTEASGMFTDFSGGIRSVEQAQQAFENGASAITIGSLAVNDPKTTQQILENFGSEKVILGADVKDGFIATAGWTNKSDQDLWSFLEYWLGKGFRKVMITDVSKDGMMQGPATELYREVIETFPAVQLIASGGVTGIADLVELKKTDCYGAITGKAIYENMNTLQDFKQILENGRI